MDARKQRTLEMTFWILHDRTARNVGPTRSAGRRTVVTSAGRRCRREGRAAAAGARNVPYLHLGSAGGMCLGKGIGPDPHG